MAPVGGAAAAAVVGRRVGARVGALVLGSSVKFRGKGVDVLEVEECNDIGESLPPQPRPPSYRRLGVVVVGARVDVATPVDAGAGAGAVPALQALPAPLYCACCVDMG